MAVAGLIGEPLGVVDGASVTVIALVEDSRCPEDVVCIWEGELRVSAIWTDSDGSETPLDLFWAYHTDPAISPGGRYTIGLDDVVQTDSGLIAYLTVRPA
jgi:hypothetical protein